MVITNTSAYIIGLSSVCWIHEQLPGPQTHFLLCDLTMVYLPYILSLLLVNSTGRPPVPLVSQLHSHLRVFARAITSAWNTLPMATPSHSSGLSSNATSSERLS